MQKMKFFFLKPLFPHPAPKPGCWDRTPQGEIFFQKPPYANAERLAHFGKFSKPGCYWVMRSPFIFKVGDSFLTFWSPLDDMFENFCFC